MLRNKKMLGDELEKYKVVDSVGEKIGKVKTVMVDTTKKKWNVTGLIISTGIMRDDVLFNIKDVEKIVEDKKTIMMRGKAKKQEAKEIFSPKSIPMRTIQERDVFSSDEEKIGGIYDYYIVPSEDTKVNPWEVWKVLIRPRERRMMGRRLRIDTEDISHIKEKIVLQWSKAEIEEMNKNPENHL